MKNYQIEDEKPTTELNMPVVMRRRGCSRHSARVGEPCWVVRGIENDEPHDAICGNRAYRAGMVGRIDPRSLAARPIRNQ